MTTTVSPIPDRQKAFETLRDIAQDAAERGRLAYAASAKPLMRARLGFDETALKYRSFRELLADAEDAGFVHLRYAMGGDVELAPTELNPPDLKSATEGPIGTEEAQNRGEARVYLRRDFWQTVVAPGQWWYDPASDAVVTATSAKGRDDLIEMPKFDDEVQESWVNQFVATLPPPRREALEPALAAAVDVPEKTSILRDQSQTVRRQWFNFLTTKAARRFEEWTTATDLEIRVSMPPRSPRKRSHDASLPPAGRQSVGTRPGAEDAIRARVHRAIERMPVSELLRISIPVEFLIEG